MARKVEIHADGDDIVFSTGTVLYANQGRLSIGEDTEPAEGYDGGLEFEELSVSERKALANYAIRCWQKWRRAQRRSEA